MRAFALLEATGPVIDDHPETIESDETPLACTLPPRFDPSLPQAVDEARALRAAYDRAVARRGTTSVGRVITTDQVSEALGVLHRWANGARWIDTPPSNRNVIAVAHDIRTYYEEAGLELVDGPPPGG